MALERRKLGVVGHPIKHSLSAIMHEAAFRELGLDYSYGLYDVEKEGLGQFIGSCRKDHIGLNVTIPYKVAVMDFLDEFSREAKLIGAVNTVKFEDKEALGYNTDGIGCILSLKESGMDPQGKKVLVIGCGGAGRAIAFQLALEGARTLLSNRNKTKAERLAGEIRDKTGMQVRATDYTKAALEDALKDSDVLINATSAGMLPNANETVVPAGIIPPKVAVMDIVYNPLRTRLLKEASERGCKTIDGTGMLVHQGAESLKIWIDVKPPAEAMKKAVLEALKK